MHLLNLSNQYIDVAKKSEIENTSIILQIAHGRILPQYSSAYALRCHSLVTKSKRIVISFAGAIFRDEKKDYSEQYRSLILTGISLIHGNRSLEIYISRRKYIRRKYLKRLRMLVSLSDIVVFEGPWQFPLVMDMLENKFIVYDAHNVEYSLRNGNKFQDECKLIEGGLLSRANIVLSVTKQDISIFKDIYDLDQSKFYFAPHIINIPQISWKGFESNHVVFIGSIYGPNNEAILKILDLAKIFPQLIFDVIGNVRVTKLKKTSNLILHGTVDDKTKDRIMSNSLLALNPVTEGSGRNLKMLDYLAHGLPIISTPIGVRGFKEYDISKAIVVSEIDNFPEMIKQFLDDRRKAMEMSAFSTQLYSQIQEVERKYDAEKIILDGYLKKRRDQTD